MSDSLDLSLDGVERRSLADFTENAWPAKCVIATSYSAWRRPWPRITRRIKTTGCGRKPTA